MCYGMENFETERDPVKDSIQSALKRWLGPLGADLPALYLVGGAVRDHWLDRRPKDIDLMCANPLPLAERLGAVHGAAVVPFVNKADAPCYRVVSRAEIDDFLDFVPMHGDSVIVDLSKRDFTINAVAIRVGAGGTLKERIDPLGGVDDLRAGIVRMAGPKAFAADPLRILRAVRFAAELDFTIDPETLHAMAARAGLIVTVAAERIVKELFAILETPRCASHIRTLDALGILVPFLPEIEPLKGCRQNGHHHLDVWQHSLAVLENLEQILAERVDHFGVEAGAAIMSNLSPPHRLAVLKLAGLLHDIGKPGTRKVDPDNGKIAFLGHDAAGAETAAAIAERLKLSRQDRELLTLLVANHMHALFWSEPAVKSQTILKWCRRLGGDIGPLILLSMADTLAACGPAADRNARQQHLAWAGETMRAYFAEIQPKLEARPLVNGNDLIALGMAPGPEMGRLLETLRQAQDAGTIVSRESALRMVKNITDALSTQGSDK